MAKECLFSSKVMAVAPADFEVTGTSRKYRLLRGDLLKALTDGAWGVRIEVEVEDPNKLKYEMHKLLNAANTWARSIELRKRHGKIVHTRGKINENGLEATMDIYFEVVETEAK